MGNRRFSVILLYVAATLGCQHEAPSVKPTPAPAASASDGFTMPAVLRSYLSVRQCVDRLKFIETPEKYDDFLKKEYAGASPGNCDWIGNNEIRSVKEQDGCDANLINGKECIVSVWRKDGTYGIGYCVRPIHGGAVVDWACSVGHSDKPLAVFQATGQPSERATFRLWAELDSYYNYNFSDSRATYYSLRMSNEDNTANIHGYLAKNDPDAEKVLDELKTGQGMRFCVQLELPNPLQSSSVAKVDAIEVGWWCDGLPWQVPLR